MNAVWAEQSNGIAVTDLASATDFYYAERFERLGPRACRHVPTAAAEGHQKVVLTGLDVHRIAAHQGATVNVADLELRGEGTDEGGGCVEITTASIRRIKVPTVFGAE